MPPRVPLGLLRKSLTTDSDDPDSGWLCGKTLKQMANELSSRLGREISVRMVRYYLALLRKGETGESKLSIPSRGWRKGRERKQSRAKTHHPWAFIYGELLALTGLTARALHAALKSIAGEQLSIPARSTFFEHLKKYRNVNASRSTCAQLRQPMLTELCTLRLHQVSFVIDPGRNYWLLVGAYETHTKYLNLAILDVVIEAPEGKKQGRPKAIPAGEPVVSVYQSGDREYIELHEDMWWGFCIAAMNELSLPVCRIETVADFGLHLAIAEPFTFSSAVIKGNNKVACYPAPNIQLDTLRKTLSTLLARHNQKSVANIEVLRASVKKTLISARGNRHKTVLGKLNRAQVEELKLREYYEGLEFKPPLLGKVVCRPQRILGRMNVGVPATSPE